MAWAREDLLPGPELADFLRQRAVTAATLPPSALAAIPTTELSELRALIVAGEACPPRWSRAGPQVGASTTPTGRLRRPFADEHCGVPRRGIHSPHIGSPIANTQIHLLDRALQPVPIGVTGEIYIGGVCVTRGYLNQPDMTAERFVPNPFSAEPDAALRRETWAGKLVLPQKPGLGLKFDEKAIKSFRACVLEAAQRRGCVMRKQSCQMRKTGQFRHVGLLCGLHSGSDTPSPPTKGNSGETPPRRVKTNTRVQKPSKRRSR